MGCIGGDLKDHLVPASLIFEGGLQEAWKGTSDMDI